MVSRDLGHFRFHAEADLRSIPKQRFTTFPRKIKVTNDLKEMGNIASDAVRENLDEVRESAIECYERGRKTAHQIERPVEQFIRERPFKSMLIAVGVGWLLGRFWIRH